LVALFDIQQIVLWNTVCIIAKPTNKE